MACSSTLLRLPAGERRPIPAAGRVAAAVGGLRALLSAARTLTVGLAVVALVAGAFAAGRVTRTTPSAGPVTTIPTETTVDDSGPATRGDSSYGWPSREQSKLSLTLDRIQVRERNSTLTVKVSGLAADETVVGLRGVSVTDKDGGQLLRGGPVEFAPSNDNGFSSQRQVDVLLPDPVEPLATVAAVTVQGVWVTREVSEEALGTLVHPGLRPLDESVQVGVPPATCRGCSLEVRCTSCRTMEVAGTDYRRRNVVFLLTPKGPRSESILRSAPPQVVIVNAATDIQPTVSSALDGTTAVRFDAAELAGDGSGGRYRFRITVQSRLEREVAGPWRMSSPP